MNKEQGKRQKEKGLQSLWLSFFLLPFSLFLFLLTGCSAGYHEPNDPFFGPQAATPPPRPPAGPTATTAAPKVAPGSLPPVPQPQGPGSPAALANGGLQPLDTNPELRITGNPNARLATGPTGTPPGSVALGGPQPLTEQNPPALVPATTTSPAPITPAIRVPAPPAATPTSTSPAATARPTEESLMTWLKSRGMTWSQVEKAQDGYHFRCAIADPLNPSVSKVYEAQGAADRISAIQAVVDQLNQRK